MNSIDDDGEGGDVISNTDASFFSALVAVLVSSFSSVSRRPPRRTRYSSKTSHAGHVLTAPVDPCLRDRMRKLFGGCRFWFGVSVHGGKSSDATCSTSTSSSSLDNEASCQNSTSSWRGRTGTRCVLHLYLALKLEVFIDDMLVRFDYGRSRIEKSWSGDRPRLLVLLQSHDFACSLRGLIKLEESGAANFFIGENWRIIIIKIKYTSYTHCLPNPNPLRNRNPR